MGFTRAEAFPSKWLNAEAFKPANGGPRTLTVREVTQEVVKDDEGEEKIKYVVWFAEEKRGLGLNVTNWLLIEAMYGDDTDNWIGKTVKLHATKVPFGKGLVDAVRVLAPDAAMAAVAERLHGPAPAAPAPAAPMSAREQLAAFVKSNDLTDDAVAKLVKDTLKTETIGEWLKGEVKEGDPARTLAGALFLLQAAVDLKDLPF